MTPERLNALTDGVVAIVLTIMVLEVKIPAEPTPEAVLAVLPFLAAYLLAFVYVAIYWNNHHHLLHACERVDGAILWANMHLLFWLSLVPFTAAWMGENGFAAIPTAAYGVVLLMSGVAFNFLVRALIAHGDEHSAIADAIGQDAKGKISLIVYLLAIPIALVFPLVAFAIYIAVALVWFVPDRRISQRVGG
jgi:uncharacterized membrane protein